MLNGILTDRLLRTAHCVMLALGIFLVGREAYTGTDLAQQAVGRDFASFWTAGRMVLNGHSLAIFDPQAMTAFQLTLSDGPIGRLSPWFYPPLLLLYVSCLFALVPYKVAYLLYLAVSVAAFYLVTRRLFPAVKPLYIISFPAFWYNLLSGQNGLLTAIIIVTGLLWLTTRPAMAGAVLALLSFKPQLCLALPVFLLLDRRWQTILAGAVTVLALAALSTALWGPPIWSAFLAGLHDAQRYNQSGTSMPPHAFAHLFGMLKTMGLSQVTAMALNYLFVAVAGCAVVRTWFLPHPQTVKFATLILLTLLLPPHLLFYDFVVTGAVMVWLWPDERLRPALIMLWIAPFVWPLFTRIGIPLFPLATALLLIQLCRGTAVGIAAEVTVAAPAPRGTV
jgi:alpha-1,2-mannosyltransferase